MMRPRLDKEVSTEELLYYRNVENLSNTEIAERLHVSRLTVCKYIGKGGPRKPYHKKETVSIDVVCGKLAELIGYPSNIRNYDVLIRGTVSQKECWKNVIRSWKEKEGR